MEINSPIKDLIEEYNSCLKNIHDLNEMINPHLEGKQPFQEEVIDPPQEKTLCYDCQMRELGITLLRAIKTNYSGVPKAISTERPKDIKPEELIELMQLQARQRDELNRGLMEEIATLRQQNNKMMADTTSHLTEILKLKQMIELLKHELARHQTFFV